MTKSVRLLSALFLVSVLMTSCYSTKIVAPSNRKVALATEIEPMDKRIIKKNWYVLWGAVPISDNKTDYVIEQEQFNKVRVETKYLFSDYLLSILLNSIIPTSISTNTTIIEGTSK
jgi:hypothetical protein